MIIAALIEAYGGNFRYATLVVRDGKLYWRIDGDLIHSFSDLTNETRIAATAEFIKEYKATPHICVLRNRLAKYPNIRPCVKLEEEIYLPFEEADIVGGVS